MTLFPDDRPRCEEHGEPLVQGSCYACFSERATSSGAAFDGSVSITLTEAQHARCLEAARRRDRQNLELGTKRRYGQEAGRTAQDNVRGCLGEGALAIHVSAWAAWGLEADDRVWARRDVAGFYEVRATRRELNLITHPTKEEHHPTAPFVLAWAEPRSRDVVLVGWAWHSETLILGRWRTNVRHPAWFTPYEKLHPMSELPPVGHPSPDSAK